MEGLLNLEARPRRHLRSGTRAIGSFELDQRLGDFRQYVLGVVRGTVKEGVRLQLIYNVHVRRGMRLMDEVLINLNLNFIFQQPPKKDYNDPSRPCVCTYYYYVLPCLLSVNTDAKPLIGVTTSKSTEEDESS